MNNQYSDNNVDFNPYNSDYKKYLKAILSRWYWFPLSLFMAFMASKIINSITTPTYKVECKLIIGDEQVQPLNQQQIIRGGIDFNRINPINKEIGILQSTALAEKTVNSLGWDYKCYLLVKGESYVKRRRYDNIPFSIVVDSSTEYLTNKDVYISLLNKNEVEVYLNDDIDITKKVAFGDRFEAGGYSFVIAKPRSDDYLIDYIGERYVVNFQSRYSCAKEFKNSLSINTDPTSSNILILSHISESVEQSIAYLNRLCKFYIQNDIDIRNLMATKTIEYIDLQLDILENQLSVAEDNLIAFKQNYKTIDPQHNTDLVKDYLDVEKQKEEKLYEKSMLNRMKIILDSVSDGFSIIIPMSLHSKVNLNNNLTQINALTIERQILSQYQSELNPDIIALNASIKYQAAAFLKLIDEELNQIEREIVILGNNIEEIEEDIVTIPKAERTYMKFDRDVELASELYNLYQQKRIEAILAKESMVSKNRVLDPPRIENYQVVSPKKSKVRRIAILLGLLIPALIIILIKSISDRVEDLNEIKHKSNTPIIGKIAHSNSEYELPTVQHPSSAIAESFHALYARLKNLRPDSDLKVIATTSGASGDGKTFCTANLAIVMANTGKKVALVSLDLRRPKLHANFELNKEPGLTNYLLNRAEKKDIIRSTSVDNLDVVVSGTIPPDPISLLSQQKLEDLIVDLKNNYDYVLIDTPPIGLVADALLISKLVDLTLIVVRVGYTRNAIFDLITELEEGESITDIGLVINDLKHANTYSYGAYNKYYSSEVKMSFKRRLKKLFNIK